MEFYPPEDLYSHLTAMKGVRFTRREVDIIACLLSARGGKAIASLLSISPKTVENHIHNIMLKVGCNSRERIIDFLESSSSIKLLRKHYLNLRSREALHKGLKEIFKLNRREISSCVLIYEVDQKTDKSFVDQLRKHLQLAGIKVSFDGRKEYKPFSKLIQGVSKENFMIYILSRTWLDYLIKADEKIFLKVHKKISPLKNVLFLIPCAENTLTLPPLLLENSIHFIVEKNHYFLILEILKRIFPHLNLQEVIAEFKEKHALIEETAPPRSFLAGSLLGKGGEEKGPSYGERREIFKKRKCYLALGVLVFLAGISGSLLYQKATHVVIRSDMVIPVNPTLLNRASILAQMDKYLTKGNGIKTIALMGPGGTGKTTLARQYARSQDFPVVWEINAETKDTLWNSFEELAEALSKTDKDKKILRKLQDIKDMLERAEKITLYVKEKLKSHAPWFLIFDNVETFSDIQPYFPSDPKTWGMGRLILTTTDSMVQNNRLINRTLFIEELDKEEKLRLFMNIMDYENTYPFSAAQKEQARHFLSFIPPYPLDVSLAAYYIKTTQISYEKYLGHLDSQNIAFDTIQQKIGKEASTYLKTRYRITILSLKQLIEIDEGFKGLLLLVSLLDSQHIPKDLLSTYQGEVEVDNFIYHLKKYSLVTYESSPHSSPSLSLHRSTQAIILKYLFQTLNLNKNDDLLQKIVDALENHMDKAIDKDEGLKMINHFETFLSHAPLLTERAKGSLKCVLWVICFYRGQYEKAKDLLEEHLKTLNRNNRANDPVMARALAYLGSIYRLLGAYGKAKTLLEQSLVVYQRHVPGNYLRVAWVLEQIGIAYKELGDYAHAIKFMEEGLKLYQKNLSENHARMAWVFSNLGTVYIKQGNYEKAKLFLEQGLKIYQQQFGENHIRVAWVLSHLGILERESGNYKKAQNLLEQSLTIYKKDISGKQVHYAWSLAHLGNVYADLKEPLKAKLCLEESLSIYSKNFSEEHIDTARFFTILAKVYRDLGSVEKAKKLLERSLLIYENHPHKNPVDLAYTLKILGQNHLYENTSHHQGKPSEIVGY